MKALQEGSSCTQEAAKPFLRREMKDLTWVRKVGHLEQDAKSAHLAAEKDSHPTQVETMKGLLRDLLKPPDGA